MNRSTMHPRTFAPRECRTEPKQIRRPTSVLPFVLTLVLLASSLVPPAHAAGPTLPAYTLEVQVDYHAATLDVRQVTRFRNATGQPLDRAVFHAASAYFGAFGLQSATAQGQPVAPSLNGTVLDVPLPTALTPGQSAEIGLDYRVDVPARPGRLSAGRRALALGNWFPTLAVHRGDWDRHQYTDVGDAFLTEVADFDVRLSTSVPLKVASTGRLVEDGGTSFRIEARGVRDFGLSLSPDYVTAEAQAGSTVVRAQTYSQARSRGYAEAAARYLRWYGEQLGVYPYQTFTVAEVDLPAEYGGMEYPGLIFISSAYGAVSPPEGGETDLLIGHEVAHQWFYSLVGNDQVNDPWLDEAFASYLPYYRYRQTLPGGSSGRPVNSSVYDFPDDGAYFSVVYRRGARFLDELRQAMGDTAFDAAVRDVVVTYADKVATPRAVLDLFQRHTTTNLNPSIGRHFTYGAFDDPAPARWRIEAPESAWRGSTELFVGAEFPLTQVEVWLDHRKLYGGRENALQLDLSGVEPGEYVLLVKVLDHRGALFERARRISIAGS